MSADRLQQVEDSLKHRYDGYVGVFDSGVGGISVLKELVKEVPDENYLFFGDSLHAPYGEKTPGEIRKLTMKGIDRLAEAGVKAIVIACNTATQRCGCRGTPEVPASSARHRHRAGYQTGS